MIINFNTKAPLSGAFQMDKLVFSGANAECRVQNAERRVEVENLLRRFSSLISHYKNNKI